MPIINNLKIFVVRNRILILIPCLLLLLILSYTLAFEFERWRISDQQKQQNSAQILKIDRELGQLTILPRVLSKDPRIVSALFESNEFTLQSANHALEQIQKDSGVAFAFLMDHKGDTIAASNWNKSVSFVGKNYSFRPYFKGAIEAQETTFFAVGATTGIPGYFIAYPVIKDATIGVIVVKIDVNNLLSIWSNQPYTTVVHDEFGVVILASDSSYLYSPTRKLRKIEFEKINNDRRYAIAVNQEFSKEGSYIWHYKNRENPVGNTDFLAVSDSIQRETWMVTRLVPLNRIRLLALAYVAMLAGLALLAALLHKIFRHQRELAEFEHNHASELAEKVEVRTRDLETAQAALIAESNFAMLGRMSAAINHEINQPLTSLRLDLATLRRLIEKDHGDNTELRSVAIDSDRTTKRIGRVIETLRNVARQGNSEFRDVEFTHVISDVVDIIRRERAQMSDYLRVELPGRPVTVLGNTILLQQALLNLIYNAFDAVVVADKPDVLLELSLTDNSIYLNVHDNGIGVAPELRDSMFSPFTSGKNKTSGLGLGLTLASQIAKNHNGNMSYKSSPLGGSCFQLSLPMTLLRGQNHKRY